MRMISTNADGIAGDDYCDFLDISQNGRYVLFFSDSSNLVAGADAGYSNLFVKDTMSVAVTCASSSSTGQVGNGDSERGAISADGRYVVFESDADNLVAGDNNNASDIFLKDLQTGVVTRVFDNQGGSGDPDPFGVMQFSSDGRYVLFDTSTNNLVATDVNDRRDIFIKDLQTGVIKKNIS